MVGFLKDFVWARLMFLNIHHLKKLTHFVLISKSNMLVTAIMKKIKKTSKILSQQSTHGFKHWAGLLKPNSQQIIFKED